MSRIALIVLILLGLGACQLASPQPSPTETDHSPISTSTPILPTATPIPPTASQIPPTQPVILDIERTNTILLIVSNQFDPVELHGTHSPLINAGFTVVVAAYTLNPLPDNEGGPTLDADLLLRDVLVEDYDAIVFIGNESLIYLHDPEAHRIAQEAVAQGRVLAALCHGPLVLAEAGLLEGKQATAWFGFGSDVCKQLKQYGATCTYARVQQDGLIITGTGPEATASFVGAIKRLLTEAQH